MRTQHHRKPRHPRPMPWPPVAGEQRDEPEDLALYELPREARRFVPHDPGRVTRDGEERRIRGWRASDMPETPRDRRGAYLK